MFRALVELIVTLVVIYLVRSVLAIVGRSFSANYGPSRQTSASQAGSQRAAGPRPASGAVSSELRKDPVCGTFVSTATAVQKNAGGQTYYFCSAECRDKFRG